MFLIGMYVGISFEKKNLDKSEAFFSESEISLMDIVALNNLASSGDVSCDVLINSTFNFANKVYEEALLLDDYEKSGKVEGNLLYVHRKYDLLRTYLWMNAIKVKEECPDSFSTVVYLYNYDVKDLTVKAKQSVWSKILMNLKSDNPDEVLLIPIATSDDFVSLEALTSELNIKTYPVVIVNEKDVLENLTSSKEIEKYLN